MTMLIIALLSTILTARIVIVSSQPIINKPYISECTLLGDTNVPSNDSSFESRGKRDASCTDSGNKNNDNERRCKETRENYESSQRTTIYPDTGQIIPLFGRNVTWILGSDDGTYINIKTTVPGDVISDLEKAAIIPDPLFSNNFLTYRHVWNGDNNVTSNADCNEVLVDNRLDCKGGTVDTKWVNRLDRQVTGRKDNDGNDSGEGIRDQEDLCPRPLEQRTRSWTYKTNFTLPTTTIDSRSSNKYVLVFEGVKMGATVKINGVALGSKNMTDQFLRYEYVIPQSVLERGHASLRSVLRKSYSNRDDNVADYAQLDHNRAGSPCYYGLCWMHICTGESTLWRIARQAMQFLLRSCSALLSLICEAKLCGVLTAENASSEKVTLSHQKNLVHELSVTFDPAIGTNGRFMACSGGWDWAPYARTGDERGSRTFTFGIVKAVYIAIVQEVFISHVVPKIYYLGPYPRPLFDGPEGDFQVNVVTHITFLTHDKFPSAPEGEVLIRNNFSSGFASVRVCDHIDKRLDKHKIGEGLTSESFLVNMTLIASSKNIHLWWPNGAGEQILYALEVCYQDKKKKTFSHWVMNRVGFRIAALVTNNETQDLEDNGAPSADQAEGSGTHGMYFRVNGALIWSRGANFIPMDQLDGRLTEEAHKIAVQSAAAANMNTLRVWGGGMILPEAFYDACDEMGLMLYHDMMFVEEGGHPPARVYEQDAEIRFVVRQLAHHPCIVLWDGCNECPVRMGTKTEIYATFVMDVVAQEDDTRAIWPSCPSSQGWRTGVFSVNGRPNGKNLTTPTEFSQVELGKMWNLEVHGPYVHGASNSCPSVNGGLEKGLYDSKIPVNIVKSDLGPQFRNTYVSEFGASVFSSIESMSATLHQSNWGIHGNAQPDTCTLVDGNENCCVGANPMAERNYPCDNHLSVYFGDSYSDGSGALAFRRQLYQCSLGQALLMKSTIEEIRASNSFGALIWQLNEIWPTGGWGCIEYGSTHEQTGQVLGGRWKPLMHLLKMSLFSDVVATCGAHGVCFCRNDALRDINATVVLEEWDLVAGTSTDAVKVDVMLRGGQAHTEWFAYNGKGNKERTVLLMSITDNLRNSLLGESVVLWTEPKNLSGLARNAIVKIVSVVGNGGNEAIVTIESSETVLYIVLTTAAQGRFVDNAFSLRKAEQKAIKFVSVRRGEGLVDIKLLRRTLNIDHLGMHVDPL